MFKTKGRGVKGFLNNVQKNCGFGEGGLPLPQRNVSHSTVFLNIVQKAPPLRFEHYVAIFFDGFFKKRVN